MKDANPANRRIRVRILWSQWVVLNINTRDMDFKKLAYSMALLIDTPCRIRSGTEIAARVDIPR
jgi:hypothetical protein